MAHDDGELRGIGGWLAFFLVTLGVITPVFSILSVAALSADAAVAASYGELWSTLLALEWSLVGITVAAAWLAVWHFFTVRSRRTVRLAVAVLWLIALLAVLGEPLGISLVTGLPLGQFLGQDVVRPLVYSTLWTAYLLKSERVANTYPAAGTDDEIAATFE
jgi:hypothetical protein